jgi:hypothetical protein
MNKAVLLFLSSYLVVLLLGFQSLCAVNYQYVGAATMSLPLALTNFYIIRAIADTKFLWYEFISYCLGGSLGIMTSMFVHQTFFH